VVARARARALPVDGIGSAEGVGERQTSVHTKVRMTRAATRKMRRWRPSRRNRCIRLRSHYVLLGAARSKKGVSAPMSFAMSLPLLVSLALLPAQAMAQEGDPAGEAPAPPSADEQPSTPPQGTPPPPPEGMSPSSPDTEKTDGQWVYTDADGWIWVPAGSTASDVNAEPYAYLYAPSIGWSWFLSPWGEGPFFVGSWVHAPHRLEGRRDGAPGHVEPRFVGPRQVTPLTPSGPRPVAPGAVGPRYVDPRYVAPRPVAPGYVGRPYVAPRSVAPSYAAPRYTAPAPVAPRYVAPPAYHAAPAPQPAFGGHMAAPVGGGGPHR
jgi:hypothetical protein